MIEKTEAPTLAYEKLQKEIEHAPVPSDVLPPEGAIAASLAKGDIFLHDPDDNERDRGAIVWISAEPDWKEPETLWVHHFWGESQKHIAILIETCEWLIKEGWGDQKIGYQRGPHPLTVLADQYANVEISKDGKFATTTPNKALAGLKAV